MRSARLVLLATLFVAASLPQAARAQAPTLAGERLQADDVSNPVLGTSTGTVTATIECDPATGRGKITYHATGIATGPYPGTFDETGTVTFVSPQVLDGGTVTGYAEIRATFRIDSPTGTVTGRKFDFGRTPYRSASCGDTGTARSFSVDQPVVYDAVVESPTGRTPVSGVTQYRVLSLEGDFDTESGGTVQGARAVYVDETFLTSQPQESGLQPLPLEFDAPTLAGETFQSAFAPADSGLPQIGSLQVTANCDPAGPSVVTFQADGTALGPYPGLFSETGRIDMTSPDPRFTNTPAQVRDATFTSTFEIDSVVGHVTGTKRTLGFTNGGAVCADETVAGNTRDTALNLQVVVYEATIVTPTGERFQVAGLATVQLFYRTQNVGGGTYAPSEGTFFEEFLTSSPLVRPNTPGKTTGGGDVGGTARLPRATFGLEAMSDARGLRGTCDVTDHTTRQTFHCLDVDSYVQEGRSATWTGRARHGPNGPVTRYRIHVDDLDPTAADTFSFQTDDGYSVGGPLVAGNVTVHPVK